MLKLDGIVDRHPQKHRRRYRQISPTANQAWSKNINEYSWLLKKGPLGASLYPIDFIELLAMVPVAGLEPATFGLQNRCSTS
jgi:hypothetical protein